MFKGIMKNWAYTCWCKQDRTIGIFKIGWLFNAAMDRVLLITQRQKD